MQRVLIISILIVAKVTFSIGQSQNYEDKLRQVDAFLSEKYTKNTPGCVIGIIKNGELIYNKGFGMANLDYGIPMTSKSVINVMSVSKQFTAAAIALLILDGKLTLAESIRKQLPELPNYMDSVTIENLIRHTSGVKDYQDLTRLAGNTPENISYRSDGLKVILRQNELNFPPNESFSYSNSGYLLLSLVIERISGQPFSEFVKERILEPLQMKNSFFSDDPHMIIKNRVVSYGKDENHNYFRYTLNDNRLGPAGLFTTIGDLYKWDQNFYHGKVGGNEFVELMMSTNTLNNGKENEYAFGNIIDRHKGFKEVFHSGGLLGITCKISRFPTEEFTIVYLGNGSQNKNNDVYPIANLFLMDEQLQIAENIKKSETIINPPPNTSLIGAYEGIYRIKNRDLLIQLYRDESTNDLIWEVLDWNYKRRLYKHDDVTFLLENEGFLDIDLENGIFKLISADGSETKGTKVATIDVNTLKLFTGTYYSDELNTSYEIVSRENDLLFQIGDIKVKAPVALQTNALIFYDKWLGKVTVTFELNGERDINSFSVSTDRTKNIKFRRNQNAHNNK
ncbi:MAG: beta-lactamase family protein [Cytophagales bacterium]|nr:beta-lactamase family protein [Cytophagales bacterium]